MSAQRLDEVEESKFIFGRRAGDREAEVRCRDCSAREKCDFSDIPDFHSIVQVRHYGPNFTVTRQGGPATHAYVVRTGLLQITHVTPHGKAIVDIVGPGWVLGAPWVLMRSHYANKAVTLQECELEQVEAEKLIAYLGSHPKASLELLKHVSYQLHRTLDLFYGVASKTPSSQRLKQALLEIADISGSGAYDGHIRLPLPIQVLADRIGCSRQWVSKILSELEARGEIKRKGSWITLTGMAPTSV